MSTARYRAETDPVKSGFEGEQTDSNQRLMYT